MYEVAKEACEDEIGVTLWSQQTSLLLNCIKMKLQLLAMMSLIQTRWTLSSVLNTHFVFSASGGFDMIKRVLSCFWCFMHVHSGGFWRSYKCGGEKAANILWIHTEYQYCTWKHLVHFRCTTTRIIRFGLSLCKSLYWSKTMPEVGQWGIQCNVIQSWSSIACTVLKHREVASGYCWLSQKNIRYETGIVEKKKTCNKSLFFILTPRSIFHIMLAWVGWNQSIVVIGLPCVDVFI